MLRNYTASAILTEAVHQGVVSETEADIVIDTAVYERSPAYLSPESGIPALKVAGMYERGLRKLKRWLCSSNLEAELLLMRYKWL